MTLIKYAAIQYFALIVGLSLLSIVNFILLIMVNSKRLSLILNLNEQTIIFLSVPFAFLFVWGIGKTLISLGFKRELKRAEAHQNPISMGTYEIVKRIEEKLDDKK